MKEDRVAELIELSEYLTENFPQYSKGCVYLLQLAGKLSMKRALPTKLTWILSGPAPGVQRGTPWLKDPEPHNVRRLRVKFHRYY